MKIENKYVEIELGKQKIKKHNLFLNSYLKLFIDAQKDNTEETYYEDHNKNLSGALYIKLDTPLQVTESSTLTENDFDMVIRHGSVSQIKNKDYISTIYTYSNDGVYELKENDVYVPYSNTYRLNDRKITGISFKLYTYLDTSEYDLRFHSRETLKITREDVMSTDAICDGYDYPYHLSPILKTVMLGASRRAYVSAHLYSVGLGYIAGIMEEEYVVGEDVNLTTIDDFTYSFQLENKTKEDFDKYPSNNLYSGSNLYPSFSEYKYIIMKYKLYHYGHAIYDPQYTGEEYTMSFPTNKKGIITIKTKIERDDN